MSQEILAFLYGQAIFRHCGADEGAEGAEGEESTEDEEEEGSKKEDKGKPSPEKLAEAARKRVEAESRVKVKNLEKELKKLQDEKSALELKDADELTKTKAALASKEAAEAKKDAALKKTAVEIAALRAKVVVDKKPVEWVDMDDVLAHLHASSDVEVDDDGEVTGVEDVLKKLAKAKPHWLKAPVAPGGRPTGVNSGNGNGTPLTADKAKTAEYMRKYPGLRR